MFLTKPDWMRGSVELLFLYIIAGFYLGGALVGWLIYMIWQMGRGISPPKFMSIKVAMISAGWPISIPILIFRFKKELKKESQTDKAKERKKIVFEISRDTGLPMSYVEKWRYWVLEFDRKQLSPISERKRAARMLAQIENDIGNQEKFSNGKELSRGEIKLLRQKIRSAS